jgi:acyl-CoA oxidase
VIHTPSIKATKWWPGDLGNFSSHAVVFAQLVIDGNKYGVQPFLVQLRNVETWRYMPGVRCGDMGPKMGYHSKNNGWCTFDQVRIPRDQMLMRYLSVSREGDVSMEGDLRALYSVMMDIRVQIALGSGDYLY